MKVVYMHSATQWVYLQPFQCFLMRTMPFQSQIGHVWDSRGSVGIEDRSACNPAFGWIREASRHIRGIFRFDQPGERGDDDK